MCVCKPLQAELRGKYNPFKLSCLTKYFIEQLMQTFKYKYMYKIRFEIVHV